jgi:hypothetical protein
MSLENIQLPDFLLVDMYKDCLIELENVKEDQPQGTVAEHIENTPIELVTGNQPIRFLGENKRNVAIILEDADAAIINDLDLTFLTNVLKACQLNLGDIAIINLHQQQVTYQQLQDQLQTATALLFGVATTTLKLPFAIPEFQVQQFAGCKYLMTPALNAYQPTNPDARVVKTNLWNSLQKLFLQG